jgi:hypothetical protein
MKKKTDLVIQFPSTHKKEFDRRIEFHNHKIQPHMENKYPSNFMIEDEWQQEYYIIYNSYILDDTEHDGQE